MRRVVSVFVCQKKRRGDEESRIFDRDNNRPEARDGPLSGPNEMAASFAFEAEKGGALGYVAKAATYEGLESR
jgi:hypothetical protein